MSEARTVKALKPIDDNPVDSVLDLPVWLADFFVKGGAAEYVDAVASKTGSEAMEESKTTQSKPKSAEPSTRLREVSEGKPEK
jgi:hypothetical protein